MINLDLDKGKQPLGFPNTMMAPIRSHQESTIEILQGTFEHINVNPLFDEIPPIPKYPKRTLRLDFSHMLQPQDVPKGTHTLGMPRIPPLEENQQSTPLLLTLPTVTISNAMEPLINKTFETSSTTIPNNMQRKSLIDITPIPQRNTSNCQVNMMTQGETFNTQRYQTNRSNMMFNSQGFNQLPQHQPTVVQGHNTSNVQPSISPLNAHSTYQQKQQPQQKSQVAQTSNIPNTQSNVNLLDLHAIYQQQFQQQFQQQQAMFAKQQEQLKQHLEYQKRLEQQIAYQQQLLQQHMPRQHQQIPLQQQSHVQPIEVSQQQLPQMTQQQHMEHQSQSIPQQVPYQIPTQEPQQVSQQQPFCLRGTNIPPPPSDTSPDSSDTEMSEPSRHSSRHRKRSTHRHKRHQERAMMHNPNEELLQQFKQLSKQVEALGVQKK